MRDKYDYRGEFTNQKISEFWETYYEDDDDYENLIDYLNEAKNFRTFDEGLTEFIKKHGYVEKEGLSKEVCIKNRTNFLKQKLKEKNIPFIDGTIKNHFIGEKRPELRDSSRENMFKICFALDLDIEETNNFFNKVYFDRTFNLKNINELVYYFCIKNKKSFNYAQNLIEKINKLLEEDTTELLDKLVYTNCIHEEADFFTEEEEVIRYVLDNKNAFNRYNTTATKQLDQLLDRIQGKKEDRKILNRIRDAKVLTSKDYKDIESCGLIIQDLFNSNSLELAKNMNVASIDFMLYVIYYSNRPVGKDKFSFHKDAKLLNVIRTNFPSKSTFSKLRTKPKYSSDAFRKALILLEFYAFCFDSEGSEEVLNFLDDFKNQMNDILDSCGMGPLYVGNPYDWLFLYCAKSESPLATFRCIINEACDLVEDI